MAATTTVLPIRHHSTKSSDFVSKVCVLLAAGICILFEYLLNPVFLVRILASSQRIFLSPDNFRPHEVQLFGSQRTPLRILTQLAFIHDSLEELTFAVASAACDARLGEIHDRESVLSVFARVLHFEVKPLLVAFGVCVHLHI